MLYSSAVEAKLLDILKVLQAREPFANLRLVGGTALALQCGHRISVDIDLFGNVNFYEDFVSKELIGFKNVQVLNFSSNILILTINGVKVDLVNYSPQWLEDPVIIDGYKMAGLKDIAAMKLSAVTNRGRKKDFYDIYELLHRMSFSDMLEAMTLKYPESSLFLTLKSLSFFQDAEEDMDPESFRQISWKEVKTKILSCIESYENNQ